MYFALVLIILLKNTARVLGLCLSYEKLHAWGCALQIFEAEAYAIKAYACPSLVVGIVINMLINYLQLQLLFQKQVIYPILMQL